MERASEKEKNNYDENGRHYHPIVTPFHRDAEQSINYEATEKLINHLIEHGGKRYLHPWK